MFVNGGCLRIPRGQPSCFPILLQWSNPILPAHSWLIPFQLSRSFLRKTVEVTVTEEAPAMVEGCQGLKVAENGPKSGGFIILPIKSYSILGYPSCSENPNVVWGFVKRMPGRPHINFAAGILSFGKTATGEA